MLEERILERMLEADELAAGQKEAEAKLAADKGVIAAERKQIGEETERLRRELDEAVARRDALAAETSPAVLGTYDTVRGQARHGGGRSEGRVLQRVPRPAPAAGRQRTPPERDRLPVRELPAHPLLPAAARQRRARRPRADDRVIDGGSRGNPAGRLRRADRDGRSLVENCTARWARDEQRRGIQRPAGGADWAADRVTSLEVRSDSELLVKQMLGVYRVKNPGFSRSTSRRACSHRIGRVSSARAARVQQGSGPPGEPRDGVERTARQVLMTAAMRPVPGPSRR